MFKYSIVTLTVFALIFSIFSGAAFAKDKNSAPKPEVLIADFDFDGKEDMAVRHAHSPSWAVYTSKAPYKLRINDGNKSFDPSHKHHFSYVSNGMIVWGNTDWDFAYVESTNDSYILFFDEKDSGWLLNQNGKPVKKLNSDEHKEMLDIAGLLE